MRRDTLEPQLPHLGIRPDEPLPFSRTAGREDDPFPDGYAFGLVFRLFRGAAGSVGQAFLFCAGREFKVSDLVVDQKKTLARPIRKTPKILNSRTYQPTWILPSYSSTFPNAPDPPLYPWVGDGPSSSGSSPCPSPSSHSHYLHLHSSGCRSGTKNCVSRERTLR